MVLPSLSVESSSDIFLENRSSGKHEPTHFSDVEFRRQVGALADAYEVVYSRLRSLTEVDGSHSTCNAHASVMDAEHSNIRTTCEDRFFVGKAATDVVKRSAKIGLVRHTYLGFESAVDQAKITPRGKTLSEICADIEQHVPWIHRYSIDPNGNFMAVFDILLIILLLFDFAYLPFMVAWGIADSAASVAYLSFAIVFWSVDLIIALAADQQLFRDSNATCKDNLSRFVQSRFPFDLFIISGDVLYLVLRLVDRSSGLRWASIIRFLRLARLLRLFRVCTVLTYSKTLGMLSAGKSRSPFLALFFRMLLAFVGLAHLASCIWFVIGTDAASDTGSSWLNLPQYHNSEEIVAGGGVHFQYLTSLQFALSMMTPSSSDVLPQNTAEKITAVGLTVMGVFTTALVTSQLSAKLVRVQTSKRELLDQEDRLTRFFQVNQVPWKLAMDVRTAICEKASASSLTVHKLPDLGMLPVFLRRDLLCNLFSGKMSRHTVFHFWMRAFPEVLEELCLKVVHHKVYPKGEEIFKQFTSGDHIYVVQDGSLVYSRDPERADDTVPVTRQCWVSMIALWCKWIYHGCLKAETPCELLCLNVERVLGVASLCPRLMNGSLHFARAYSELAAGNSPDVYPELDIPHERVLLAMPIQARCTYAEMLITGIEKWMSVDKKAKLLNEVELNKCVISLDRDGSVLRTSPIYVMQITSPEDNVVLHEVASSANGVFTPEFRLPAFKAPSANGESAEKVAMTFFESRLPRLACNPVFLHAFADTTRCRSSKFGLETQYIKTTLMVEVESGEAPTDDSISDQLSKTFLAWYKAENPDIENDCIHVFPVLDSESNVLLYGWLEYSDAQWMSNNCNNEALQVWLESVNYSACIAEAGKTNAGSSLSLSQGDFFAL